MICKQGVRFDHSGLLEIHPKIGVLTASEVASLRECIGDLRSSSIRAMKPEDD